jgi:hypothetical protein
MDYKAAIAKVAADLPEVAEIIMGHVGSLNSESASRRHELSEALKVIQELKKIAGEDADLVKFASETKKKSENNDATVANLQTKLDAALVTAATEQRQYLLLKAAQLSKADEKALHKLLEAVPTDKIAVDSEVKIEGKTLKDYAVAQGEFWERALFPTAPSEAVPTGGASPETPANPTSVYLSNQASALAKTLGIK